MNKANVLSSIAILITLISGTSNASLSPSATLIFDDPVVESGLVVAGSNFGVDFTNDGVIDLSERTGLVVNDGLILGVVQPGSVTSPGIDQPWDFFGQQGIHKTTSPVTIISDDGVGNIELDFSGWSITWNNVDVALGGVAWGSNPDGVAIMTCGVDCSFGDTFNLFYTATVTEGPFTGVRYRLGFDSGALSVATAGLVTSLAVSPDDPGVITTGIIAPTVPIPPAIWLFASGLLVFQGISGRKRTHKVLMSESTP